MKLLQARELNAVTPHSGRVQCWVESLLLGLGTPVAIWAVSRLITFSIPAAVHGSPEQRFFYWLMAGAIVEWLFVAVLCFVLRHRKLSLSSFGVWRFGNWSGWLVALLIAFLTIASNLRFFPRMHIPIANAFFPHGFHLLAAIMIGVTAGFCEEVLFRAFLMTQFASAGYGKLLQVLMPGIAFGLSHAGYLNQGFLAWLGIVVPTAMVGMIWGIAYLLGRRSLVPTMVAHFLNDSTALPWITFFMITAR